MSLMPYDQALDKLLEQIYSTQKTELVPILQARGRILAEAIVAQQDSPIFDNSAMDGYAICGLDLNQWQLIDYIAAGDSTRDVHLKHGQAVRIFTGSAIPSGTEAVVIQENVELVDGSIHSTETIKAQQHIRYQAEEFARDSVLVAGNQQLNATHIGVAASQGIAEVLCYQPLKVTVFSSGNELQPVGKALQENQIFDSNRYMLLALLEQNPCLLIQDGGLLPDQFEVLQQQLSQAAVESDVVLISGGASVGDKDLTKQVLESLGELEHWKLAIKPGKPFAWGNIANSKVFVLPGNPVACWVTYLVLASPALKILSGMDRQLALPKTITAQAQFEIKHAQSRLQFLRGNIDVCSGQLHAHIHPLQSSSMLANCGTSNALVIVPKGETIVYGQEIQIMYLNSI